MSTHCSKIVLAAFAVLFFAAGDSVALHRPAPVVPVQPERWQPSDLLFFYPACDSVAQLRSAPEVLVQPEQRDPADGYCPTWQGNLAYEYIESATVDINPEGRTITLTVEVYIANPGGCVAGLPCPEYDCYPEYLNAWIDWNNDSVWSEPDERVLDMNGWGITNINYQGTMTLTDQAPIPDGVVGTRKMRVSLGYGYDPNNPCAQGWQWGHSVDYDVEFYNLAITRISALNDIPIKNVHDPIWCMELHEDGTVTDATPPGDRLIAAPTTTDSIYLRCKVDFLPPEPPYTPKVECEWEYLGLAFSGKGSFTGWEDFIPVAVPDRVGFYQLSLRFSIRDENGNKVREQHAVIPTYVTFDTPHPEVTPPDSTWVDRACRWADGASDADGVTDSLNAGIYCLSGGIYEAYVKSWPSYVSGGSGQKVDCQTFSGVWKALSLVHGLKGADVTRNMGSHYLGFVTKPATSVDGKTGNAYAKPAKSIHDRWVFGMHQVGIDTTYGSATPYWDPTFDRIYAGSNDYIEWNLIGAIHEDTLIDEDWRKIVRTGNTVGETWPEFTYPGASRATDARGFSLYGYAQFTGNFTDSAFDDDGDGWYDRFRPTAEVQVSQEGAFSFGAWLFKGEQAIANRPAWNFVNFTHLDTLLPVGTHYVPLTFSGEQIYRSGEDGPYRVPWGWSSGGVGGDTVQVTSALNHMDFGELPARIQGFADAGLDTDGDGLFDTLRCSVSVLLSQKGDYHINAWMTVGDTLMVALGSSIMDSAGPGVVVFPVDFPGSMIWEHRLDGPYNVRLWVHHDKGFVEQSGFVTGPYSYTDFDPPAVRLNGLPTVTPIDLGADGRYDSLIFTLPYLADSASWNLGWIGYLQDPDGGRIATAKALSTGDTVHLAFFGQDIYKSGRSGPYLLSPVGVSSPRGSFRFHDVYTTPAYTYDQFEAPPPPLVTFVGYYLDEAWDSTETSPWGYLWVLFDVITSYSGTILGSAELVDDQGEHIAWGPGQRFYCPAGQVVHVPFRFDGSAIWRHGKDGPYYTKNLLVYNSFDPRQHYRDTLLYATGSYAFTDFDPGFLCGDVNGNSDGPNVADLTYFIAFMWRGGPPPPVLEAANADGANGISVSDVTFLIAYLFRGGLEPNCRPLA